jgi:hypothetical protein
LAGIVEPAARFAVVTTGIALRRLAPLVHVADALPLLVELSLVDSRVAAVAAAGDDDEREYAENDGDGRADAALARRPR